MTNNKKPFAIILKRARLLKVSGRKKIGIVWKSLLQLFTVCNKR